MMQSMGMPMSGFMNDFGGMPGMPRSNVHHNDPFSAMMPHGFMSPMSMMMMNPFQSMQQAMSMANNGSANNFSYCSSSVTSYTTDEHGRPQVYQQSNEVKQGPNGLKETKSAVRDSRTGRHELAIGHHLQDKAHIKKKAKNVHTGEEEEGEDLINLEEHEAETFEQNWTRQARDMQTSYDGCGNRLQYGRPSSSRNRLALTSGPNDDQYHPSSSGHHGHNSSSSLHNSPEKSSSKKEKKKKKSKFSLNLL